MPSQAMQDVTDDARTRSPAPPCSASSPPATWPGLTPRRPWRRPPYWILMGATAIIVLAGARILGLPASLAAVKMAAGFVEGFSFALWAFMLWVALAAWVAVAAASVARLRSAR